MKLFRESFEENYIAVEVPCDNKKGFKIRYEYYGPWYLWNLSADAMKRMKISIALCCVVGIFSFFFCAFRDTVMNYRTIVSVPGMLSNAAMLFEVIGVIQFLFSKEKLTRLSYRDIDRKLRIATLLHALLLMATVIACIYVWAMESLPFSSALPLFGYLLSGLCSAIIFYLYHRLSFRTEENSIIQNSTGV